MLLCQIFVPERTFINKSFIFPLPFCFRLDTWKGYPRQYLWQMKVFVFVFFLLPPRNGTLINCVDWRVLTQKEGTYNISDVIHSRWNFNLSRPCIFSRVPFRGWFRFSLCLELLCWSLSSSTLHTTRVNFRERGP